MSFPHKVKHVIEFRSSNFENIVDATRILLDHENTFPMLDELSCSNNEFDCINFQCPHYDKRCEENCSGPDEYVNSDQCNPFPIEKV